LPVIGAFYWYSGVGVHAVLVVPPVAVMAAASAGARAAKT